MHSYDLILTLTGGLGAALGLGYVTQRLGLSPIVGYLLAGIAVGPNTPGFVANHHADTLKQAGVEGANGLILSATGMRDSKEVIRLARTINPSIQILARSVYVHE